MKFSEYIGNDPIKFSQIVAGFLFAISGIAILIGWIADNDKESLQVPLMIMGISVVYLLVTSVKSGFALTISLLVVATIVTTEDFIIKVSHLVKQGGSIESYLDSPQIVTKTSPKQNAKIIAEKILAELDISTDKIDIKVIERVLKESDIERLAREFGHNRALAELKNGKGWARFVKRWGADENFMKEISELRSTGLVTCPEGNNNCSLTKLGDKVATLAAEKGNLFDISSFSEFEDDDS